MDDLLAFLRARLDEDEQAARAVLWDGSGNTLAWHLSASATVEVGEEAFGTDDRTVANHIVSHDPARVLREVTAKRHILTDWERYVAERRRAMGGWYDEGASPILAALAAVYADHPDYRPEWAPPTGPVVGVDDLLEVARQYEQEATRPLAPRHRRRTLQEDAALLRRIVANREAADPNRLNPARAGLFDVIERWCSQHGYRCSFGIQGMTLQRGTEPPLTVGLHDTLAWDGHTITVAAGPRGNPS